MVLYQAQLSRDGGVLNKSPCPTAKMADCSRENEMVATSHPGQHLTVLGVMSCSKQVGKVTIEYGSLPTKTTKSKKY